MVYVTESNHDQFQEVKLDEKIIIAEGLEKKFGSEAVISNVTFYVPRGAIFGFIGPSGSGKTTTIRLITGIYEPTSGNITVFGKKPKDFTQGTRARIGYMPQLFVLYPNLTIWENINFAASLYGMGLGRKKRLNSVLDFVELSEHKHKLARNISGGMQRRLTLAATLLHDPELLFLDEPTAGIDPVLRRKFWDHFRDLQKDGSTMFITTQYVNEASYCDLVAVMNEGKLVVVDTPDGLRKRVYGGEVVDIRTTEHLDYRLEERLDALPFVRGPVTRTGSNSVRIVVEDAGEAVPSLMEWSQGQKIGVESVDEYLPPFDDVFVELVRSSENG
jgi:ABC-2 type transport system ATP-binding protein